MKKKSKTYNSLADQGIKKAWDKLSIFKPNIDSGHTELQMVVYYAGKPFAYWCVEDAFDVEDIKLSLYCMLDYYESINHNYRVISKRITRYFLKYCVFEKLITYKRGGVLMGAL